MTLEESNKQDYLVSQIELIEILKEKGFNENFYSSLIKLKNEENIKYTKIGRYIYYYKSDIPQVIEYYKKHQLLLQDEENFISQLELLELLKRNGFNIPYSGLGMLRKKGNIDFVKIGKYIYYNRLDIPRIIEYYKKPHLRISKKNIDQDKLISQLELIKLLNNKGFSVNSEATSLRTLRDRGKIGYKKQGKYIYYEKSDVPKIIDYFKNHHFNLTEEYIKENYITFPIASKELDRNKGYIWSLFEIGEVQGVINFKGTKYLPKEEFIRLLNVKKSIENTIELKELAETLPISYDAVYQYIGKNKLKSFLYNGHHYISLDEAKRFRKYIEERFKPDTKENLLVDFEEYVNQNQLTNNLTETNILYKKWSMSQLNNSQAGIKRIKEYISTLIKVYQVIIETFHTEFFLANEEEIKIILSNKKHSKMFNTNFLNFLNFCLKRKGIKWEKTYSIDCSRENKDDDKTIYSPEIYNRYYQYVQKLELHTTKALKSRHYANMWLYVNLLMQLNWRGNDIIQNFPDIDLAETRIEHLDWFLSNSVSEEQEQIIINQLYQKVSNLLASKTKALLNFFVIPELSKSLVTSIIISELHRRNYKGHYMKHKSKPLGTLIIGKSGERFATSGNNLHLKFFHGDTELANFSSLILNRSTMTYLYYSIVEEDGEDSDIALEIVQHTRSHDRKDTTSIYVQATNNDGSINRVSLNLFNRGHFGWLYNFMLRLAFPEGSFKNTLEERTSLIKSFKMAYSPMELEKWAKYLLKKRQRKNSVVSQLIRMNQEDLLSLILKIYLGKAPSKQKNGQCLIYPNCLYPKSNNCFECDCFIPQQMVLIEIATEFRFRVNSLKETKFYATTLRDSKFILNLLLLLSEAEKVFGREKLNGFITASEISALFESIQDKLLIEGD